MTTDAIHTAASRGIIFMGLTSESPLADIIAAAERAATDNADGDVRDAGGFAASTVDRDIHDEWIRYDIHDANVLDGLASTDRERVLAAAWDARQVALDKAGAR